MNTIQRHRLIIMHSRPKGLFLEVEIEKLLKKNIGILNFLNPNFREAQLARERAAKEVAERLEREHAEEVAKRGKGAAIAPPTELMEPSVFEPEPPQGKIFAYLRNISNVLVEEIAPVPKKFVVSNIMSRMGYVQGLGLG